MITLVKNENGDDELSFDYEDINRPISILMDEDYPQEFIDCVDEITEPFKIGELSYEPSKVIANIEPILLKEIYLDWENDKIGELQVAEDIKSR